MRIWITPCLAVICLLAATAAAQESIVKDGTLTDKTWNLTYATRGLERGLSTQKPNVIFEGRAAGSVQIEIQVLEQGKKLDANGWRTRIKDAMTKAKKPILNVEESKEGVPTLVFTETKLDIFNEHHGYAFYPRGFQCFVVHAYVADKTEKSGARIKECLGGLKLGEGTGATMFEVLIAAGRGWPINDPRVTLAAGQSYAFGQQGKGVNLELAAQVLERARKAMKADTYKVEEQYALFYAGGYAFLAKKPRDAKKAIEWLTKCEETAKKLPEQARANSQAGAAYNLACAYSLDGDTVKAFETLHRAFADTMPVNAKHLTDDTDLDNLKKDQANWDKFWKERVEGR